MLVCQCTKGSVFGHGWLKWWTRSRKTYAQKLSATAEGRTSHTWRCCWLGQAVFHVSRLVKVIPATWCLVSDTADGSGVRIHLYEAVPETCLMQWSVLWRILSWAYCIVTSGGLCRLCTWSLIFRPNGQKSRNPLQIQYGGRYGQRAVISSRGYGKLAVEGCVEVSDDFTELVTLGRWRDGEGTAWAFDSF